MEVNKELLTEVLKSLIGSIPCYDCPFYCECGAEEAGAEWNCTEFFLKNISKPLDK